MKIIHFILAIFLFLMGSQVISSQLRTGDLSVLDFLRTILKKVAYSGYDRY